MYVLLVVAFNSIDKLGGREGLSSRKNHYDERSKCLNIFAEMYGYLPLLNSTVVLAKF